MFCQIKIKTQFCFIDDVHEINNQICCILSGPPCIEKSSKLKYLCFVHVRTRKHLELHRAITWNQSKIQLRFIPGVPKKRNGGFSVPCDLKVS